MASPAVRRRIASLGLIAAAVAGCGGDDPAGTQGVVELSDAAISFDAEQYGGSPSSQTVTVTSSAGQIGDLDVTIDYAPSEPTGWLTASLSDETTPATLTLTATTSTVPGGIHVATVSVAPADDPGAAKNIAVTFRVAPLLGYPVESPNVININFGFLYGLPIVVPSPTNLVSVNFIVKSPLEAGTQAKVGLYADNAGNPGALVAGTPATTVILGRNEIPVTAVLAPGTYWFMIVVSKQTYFSYGGPHLTKNATHPFADPLPNPFPSLHSTSQPPGGLQLNFFLKTTP